MEKLLVLKTPGVVGIVGVNGTIEPVSSDEIEAIRTLVMVRSATTRTRFWPRGWTGPDAADIAPV